MQMYKNKSINHKLMRNVSRCFSVDSKRKVGFCLAIHEIGRFHGREGYNDVRISV